MNIWNKVEEIREKPEYIRIRYVWGLVAIFMAFILIVWIVSLKENLGVGRSQSEEEIIYESFSGNKDVEKQKPSLEKYSGESVNIKNEIGNSNNNLEE